MSKDKDNYLALDRDELEDIEERFSPRISGAACSVFLRMLLIANHTPGFFEGKYLERGDVNVSLETLREKTGLSTKTIRNAIHQLIIKNEIVKKGANEGANGSSIYQIVNYNTCDAFYKKGANEVASMGQAWGKHGATSKEFKEEKRIESNPSSPPISLAHASESEAAPPPPPEAKLSRPKQGPKPKAETNPLTNPDLFLKRVETSGRGTVIVWGKDNALVKRMLGGRLRAGVANPQAEMWGLWERFTAGEMDGAFSMQDRAHDIPAFIYNYSRLLEKTSGNGQALQPTPPGSAPPPPRTHNSGAGVYDRTCPDCGQQLWKCNLNGCPARKTPH